MGGIVFVRAEAANTDTGLIDVIPVEGTTVFAVGRILDFSNGECTLL